MNLRKNRVTRGHISKYTWVYTKHFFIAITIHLLHQNSSSLCYHFIRFSGGLPVLRTSVLMHVHDFTFQFLKYDVQMPALHDFTFCIWVKSSNFSHPHPLFSYSSELQEEFFLFLWCNAQCNSAHPTVHIHASNSTNFTLIYMTFEARGFKLKVATRSSFVCWLKHNGNFNLDLQMLLRAPPPSLAKHFARRLLENFLQRIHITTIMQCTYDVTLRLCNQCCSWKAVLHIVSVCVL